MVRDEILVYEFDKLGFYFSLDRRIFFVSGFELIVVTQCCLENFFVDVERYLYSGMNYILQKQSGWPLIF